MAMKFCFICFNGVNQGADDCFQCGRKGSPLPPWATTYFVVVLLAATLAAWGLPLVTDIHRTAAQQGVLYAVLPLLGFLFWKLR